MPKVTKEQISDILLYPLANHYVFNGKMEFTFNIMLDALDRMDFQDEEELIAVRNVVIDTYKDPPMPPEIKDILNKHRQGRAAEVEQKLQDEKLKCLNNSNPDDWSKVLQMLLNKYGQDTFRNWFADLQFHQYRKYEAIISVPTRFIRQYIMTHYERNILAGFKKVNPNVRNIRFTVRPQQEEPIYSHGRKAAQIAEKRYG